MLTTLRQNYELCSVKSIDVGQAAKSGQTDLAQEVWILVNFSAFKSTIISYDRTGETILCCSRSTLLIRSFECT